MLSKALGKHKVQYHKNECHKLRKFDSTCESDLKRYVLQASHQNVTIYLFVLLNYWFFTSCLSKYILVCK